MILYNSLKLISIQIPFVVFVISIILGVINFSDGGIFILSIFTGIFSVSTMLYVFVKLSACDGLNSPGQESHLARRLFIVSFCNLVLLLILLFM